MSHKPFWITTFFIHSIKLLIIGLLAVLVGCVQKTSVPNFARAGDTIILGLGGIQRNANGEQRLSASDLQITATRVGGGAAPITLAPSTIFKSFPDYGSSLNSSVIAGAYPTSAGFSAFDGGWFVTVTLPNDGSLTPGSYMISITSPTNKLVNTKFDTQTPYNPNNVTAEGDLTQLPLEIVSGTGSNASYASQFASYANISSIDISPTPNPSTLPGLTAIGGLQLVITYPQTRYNPALPPMTMPYNHNPYIQLSQNVVDNGNGTKTMVVLLSAQQGFVSPANRTPLTPLLSDLSLRMLYFVASGQSYPTAAQIASEFQIDTSRSHYYDTNGNVIAGLQPTLTLRTN